ncbi:MAG: Rrf2 family transcriptional regulator [Synechococcaceae cyanobacterium]|nr:Rrf2 family transcriptional regulator [Synechococcaceae cyanobacterium]
MLRKSGIQAIHALLELALAAGGWRSVHQLALVQELPEPTLEQLLLRLRRAGLVQARRGRQGGYRLAGDPGAIAVAAILAATAERTASGDTARQPPPAWERAAAGASGMEDATRDGLDPETLRLQAGRQVTTALEQRLRRAIERELAALTLADLVFDLQSAQASLSEDGGLLLG